LPHFLGKIHFFFSQITVLNVLPFEILSSNLITDPNKVIPLMKLDLLLEGGKKREGGLPGVPQPPGDKA
jgi:hypothetical protein